MSVIIFKYHGKEFKKHKHFQLDFRYDQIHGLGFKILKSTTDLKGKPWGYDCQLCVHKVNEYSKLIFLRIKPGQKNMMESEEIPGK